MVDSHFMLGMARVAVAGDPDLLAMHCEFLASMGAEIIAAVSPVKPTAWRLPVAKVIVGDLEDLELAARGQRVQLVVSIRTPPARPSAFGRAADARRLSAV